MKSQAAARWADSDVSGRCCRLFEPASPNPHGFHLLYLHDRTSRPQEELRPFLPELERYGLPVVAPVAGPCWWADRITAVFDQRVTAERFLRESVVPWLAAARAARPPAIALLGQGMGGQAALRLAYKCPHLFPVVAAVSPDLDFHFHIPQGDEVLFEMYGDVESARQDTAILHIHPLNWPRHQFFCCHPADEQRFEGAERLRMKLSSIGIPFEAQLAVEPGEKEPYAQLMAAPVVEFIVQRLERERLRVV